MVMVAGLNSRLPHMLGGVAWRSALTGGGESTGWVPWGWCGWAATPEAGDKWGGAAAGEGSSG